MGASYNDEDENGGAVTVPVIQRVMSYIMYQVKVSSVLAYVLACEYQYFFAYLYLLLEMTAKLLNHLDIRGLTAVYTSSLERFMLHAIL